MKPLKLASIVVCSLLTTAAFSQNWQLGGNGLPQLNSTNNILGSDNTANLPLRVQTNGIQRTIVNATN